MARDGWRGRPLLVEVVREGWLAWTGTHRLSAALCAGVWEVPVVEVNQRLWTKAHGAPFRSMLSETFEDECRLGWLEMTGDKPAIALMRKEVLYGATMEKCSKSSKNSKSQKGLKSSKCSKGSKER